MKITILLVDYLLFPLLSILRAGPGFLSVINSKPEIVSNESRRRDQLGGRREPFRRKEVRRKGRKKYL